MDTTLPAGVTIEEIPIPQDLSGTAGADFIELTEVLNRVDAHTLGDDNLPFTPEELLSDYRNPYETYRPFVARLDGRMLGYAVYELQSGEDPDAAWFTIEVLPEHRRRGIGSALHERLLELARSEGRRVVQSFAQHRLPLGPDTLQAPTGFGAVPLDASTTFLQRHGYRLAQVERRSRLRLPLRIDAVTPAPGYSFVAWIGATPDDLLEHMAVLQAKMSTDAPWGELDFEPEEWDAQRVRDWDERKHRSGRTHLVLAVRHDESGVLAGYTELALPLEARLGAIQDNTIVLHEHRGHRLGMALKRENLRRLQEFAPERTQVNTWNAEENRHMLGVNEALGFMPVSVFGSWRRATDE